MDNAHPLLLLGRPKEEGTLTAYTRVSMRSEEILAVPDRFVLPSGRAPQHHAGRVFPSLSAG